MGDCYENTTVVEVVPDLDLFRHVRMGLKSLSQNWRVQSCTVGQPKARPSTFETGCSERYAVFVSWRARLGRYFPGGKDHLVVGRLACGRLIVYRHPTRWLRPVRLRWTPRHDRERWGFAADPTMGGKRLRTRTGGWPSEPVSELARPKLHCWPAQSQAIDF